MDRIKSRGWTIAAWLVPLSVVFFAAPSYCEGPDPVLTQAVNTSTDQAKEGAAKPTEQGLEDLENLLESFIDSPEREQTSKELGLARELFRGAVKHSVVDAQKNLNEKKMDLLDDDLGLNITGYYTNKIQDGVFENDGGSATSTSYAGVEWDLLKDGLLERNAKKRALEKEMRIQGLLDPELRKEDEFPSVYYGVIHTFNTAKIARLEEWVRYLDRYIEAARKLYHYKYYGWEDLIKLKSDRAAALNMLKNCRSFNSAMPVETVLPRLDANSLPVADIDLQKLTSMLSSEDVYPRVAALEKEKAREGDGVANNVHLKAFLRYYTSDMLTESSRDDVAAGVYIKVPLPLSTKKRDALMSAQDRLTDYAYARKSLYRLDQMRDVYYEYQYKLNDVLTFNFRKALVKERLRKEMVRKRFNDPEYNPLRSMQLANELYAINFELLDLKLRLYLKLLEAYRYSGNVDLFRALSVVDLQSPARKYEASRSAYMWSDSFNSIENDFLTRYLKNREISELLISFSENTDKEKLAGFLDLALKNEVRVHAMIGENDLIFPEKREILRAKLEASCKQGCAGVHLDMEPHTFADWDEKKDYYMKEYADALSFAKDVLKQSGKELSVSIPMHFPAESLKDIFAKADRVFVMAYGVKDIGALKRRLAEEVEAGRDKLTIALRPSDFENRAEFEEFVKNAAREITGDRVAVHDIKGLLGLDEAGLKPNIDPGMTNENP